jgi:Domain of unknown function (DUF4157)
MKALVSQQKTATSPRTFIQPKLMVNAPHDVYEQEANAIADRVMRMPLVSSKVQGTQGILASSVQRKCAHCEEEEKKKPIMRKAEGGGGSETLTAFASQLSNTRGGGQAMPRETKSFMESRFGQDFSHVRLHTDGTAANMNRDIQAKAFTHGSDIYFNRGEFAPNTEGGKRLLAHELVHTVQQQNSNYFKIQKQDESVSIFGGIPDFLDCELADVQSDWTTSCCKRDTLSRLPSQYNLAREHTDRAIQRMSDSANMDSAITLHFGSGARWYRQTILENLRTIRRELDLESTHQAVCRIALGGANMAGASLYSSLDRALFCRMDVLASATPTTTGEKILTLCLDSSGNFSNGWTTILHEVAHFSRIALLPARERASPEQVTSGEFETYEHGDGYPNPMPFSLRNADSYASFVRDIGTESWSEESNAAAFAPTIELGSALTLDSRHRFGLAGRAMWTPLGSNLQLITGVGGLYLPQLGSEVTRPSDLRAYAGPELGLRWITGGRSTQFVLDVVGGGGSYVRVDESVDAALSARIGLGVRFGNPSAGFGISTEVMRLFNISTGDITRDATRDLFGSIMLRAHWGGSSSRPR